MEGETSRLINDHLVQSREVLEATIEDPRCINTIGKVINEIAIALSNGRKVLLAGNGGSAGDAQHIAGEFVCRLNYDRAPLAAIALTTDTSVLTAVANDYGYEHVFARQVLGLGCAGDVLMAISTSGDSANVLRAIEAARQRRMIVIGLTGRTGGAMAVQCDLCLQAPTDSTPLIQQIHITIAHAVCGVVETRLFPRASNPRHLVDAAGQ